MTESNNSGIGVLAHAALLRKKPGDLQPALEEAAAAIAEAEHAVVNQDPGLQLATAATHLVLPDVGDPAMNGVSHFAPPNHARLTWRPREIKRLQRSVHDLIRGIAPTALILTESQPSRKRLREDEERIVDSHVSQLQQMTDLSLPKMMSLDEEDINLQDEMKQDLLMVKSDQIDWEKLTSLYMTNRTAIECKLKWEELQQFPLARGKWTKDEDDRLREAVRQYGESSWKACRLYGNHSNTVRQYRSSSKRERHNNACIDG